MEYTENITEIKINVQAAGIRIGDDVKDTIRKCITRLRRFYDRIEWADIYIEDKAEKKTHQNRLVPESVSLEKTHLHQNMVITFINY